MANWATDTELFDLARKALYVAVVGDVMDELGYHDQFLPAGIKPVSKGAVVIGRAMPVLEADVPFDTYESTRSLAVSKPFGLMLDALDDLQPDEVYICTGSSPNYALWGELMSTRASYLGAAGAVVDGYNRDMRAIRDHAFPVFSQGSYAQDQKFRGKVIDYRVPIRIRNVHVQPGDIVFGDVDGVCIVPKAIESEVFEMAMEKISGENTVRTALDAGMGAVDAFEKYHVM